MKNTVQKLKAEFLKTEPSLKEVINIDKNKKFLHLNCADHQIIFVNENNEFEFATVGGSRYCWLETFAKAEDCIQFAITNITCKDNTQIDEEYRNLWKTVKESV